MRQYHCHFFISIGSFLYKRETSSVREPSFFSIYSGKGWLLGLVWEMGAPSNGLLTVALMQLQPTSNLTQNWFWEKLLFVSLWLMSCLSFEQSKKNFSVDSWNIFNLLTCLWNGISLCPIPHFNQILNTFLLRFHSRHDVVKSEPRLWRQKYVIVNSCSWAPIDVGSWA